MDSDWVLTLMVLDELGDMGYNEVWLGAGSSHWPDPFVGLVVAAPKRVKYGWPAVWHLTERCGYKLCGNGLKCADQAQYHWFVKPLKGHFSRNEDGTWTKT